MLPQNENFVSSSFKKKKKNINKTPSRSETLQEAVIYIEQTVFVLHLHVFFFAELVLGEQWEFFQAVFACT